MRLNNARKEINNAVRKLKMKLIRFKPLIYFTQDQIYMIWLGYEWCLKK